jgi:aldehyde:ferredoxin oxidoreductase
MAGYGYAGEILRVDLTTRRMSRLETAPYADRFLGGKGIAAKLYWDMVPPRARAFDPQPVAGLRQVGGRGAGSLLLR